MHINDLPNDCLILILTRTNPSLPKLITLRSVCTRWSAIISIICRSCKSLKLFGNVYNFLWCHSTLVKLQHEEDGRELTQTGLLRDVIQFRGTTEEAVGFLPMLFPNVTKLFFSCPSNQVKLWKLIACWPHQIESLTIWGEPETLEDWPLLWRSIHSQSGSLQQLYLMDFEHLDIPLACGLPGWLRTIGIKGHHDYQSDIFLSYMKENCRHVALEQTKCTASTFLNMNSRGLTAHLTHLTICEIDDCTRRRAKSYLSIICEHFKALEYFYPKFAAELQLDEIQPELAKLPALAQLRLHLSNNNKVGLATGLPYPGAPRTLTFPSHRPLTSIHTLSLDNYKFLPFFLQQTRLELLDVLPKLFTGIRQLTIRYQYLFMDSVAGVVLRDNLVDQLESSAELRRVWPNLDHYRLLHDETILAGPYGL